MLFDIHTHILPGVDDGSKTLENSIEMIKEEIANGVTDLILTPHFCFGKTNQLNKEELTKHFNEFKDQVKDYDINLYLGSELLLSHDYLTGLKNNKALTLNGSKYLLVEFDFGEERSTMYEKIFNVTCLGYIPIVAHFERYHNGDIDLAIKLKKCGALIQVNTTSILGNFGKDVKKRVFKLLKNKLVDFIASDSHSMGVRKPNLKEALTFVNKKFKQSFDNKIDGFDEPFICQDN